ncbi:hypothetical protein Hanom_Chr15g01407621 [Helianthus anomalus]
MKIVITIDAEVTGKKGVSIRATAGAFDKGTLRFRQSNLEDYIIASNSLEGLSCIGEKKTSAAGSKSSGSTGLRNPDAGTTPSSIALDEEDWGSPVIGKQSKLRSPYKFSPEAQKKATEKTKGVQFKDPQEPPPKMTKFIIKSSRTTPDQPEKPVKKVTKKVVEKEKEKEKGKEKEVEKPVGEKPQETEAAATVVQEKARGPKVTRITGLDQPLHEKEKETTRGKGPEVVKPTELTHKGTTIVAGGTSAGGNVRSSAFAAGQAGAGSQSSMPHPPIGTKDTLGDIYYKTYTEEARGDSPHQAPWGLKQKDTFLEFASCRDWLLNSFPPSEVNRQRARTHDGLYHAYIVGEANTRAANHQIVREWRTMVKERGDWEKYRERLLRQVKDFEKLKAAFAEEKAKFKSEKKSEEWGRQDFRGKLCAAEEL